MGVMSNASKNALFATLCSSCFVLALLSTALNTVLPAIGAGLGVPSQTAQWLVSGYVLALAISMPATGFAVSRFASRPLYIAALGFFVLCSLCCALSPSFAFVMAARVGQAVANALVSNLTQVTILSMYTKEQRGTRMGWFGLSVGVAPVVAPALGGMVVDAWGWRALFVIVAVAGTACFAAALTFMRNALPAKRASFDALSFGLSIVLFGGLTIGLGRLVSGGLYSISSWGPLLCAAAAAAVFVPRQLHAAGPFLDLRLFANGRFARSVIASAALYAVMMGGAAVLPVYLQQDSGCSASLAGAVVLPAALFMALVNPLAGRAFDRMGIRSVAVAGVLLLLVGCGGMCLPGLNAIVPGVVVLTALRYVGIGLVQMPLVTWGNGAVDDKDTPQATALLTSFRNIAGALGVAVFVGVWGSGGVAVAFAGMVVVSLLVLVAAKVE